MKKMFINGMTLCSFILITACSSTLVNQNDIPQTKLTVGVIQKEIKRGMSQEDVASALGSPNIVTSSSENQETWVYDKITSSVDYNQSQSYGTLILIGKSEKRGIATSSQKTLTVIIKFDKGVVNDFKYHSSSF